MKIKGFEKLSCVDYPHHLACVIFLGGCNMRCSYCYNKKLVTHLQEVNDIEKETVFDYINKRKKMLEGICVSGGEPTVNPDLPDFLKELKQFGLPLKLDTNGTHPELIKMLIRDKLVDYFALDIKVPLDTRYTALTKLREEDTEKIKTSLRFIALSEVEFEIRTTVIPTIHSPDVFDVMKEHVLEALGPEFDPHKLYWYLQPFFPRGCINENFNELPATSTEQLQAIAQELRKTFPHVMVR